MTHAPATLFSAGLLLLVLAPATAHVGADIEDSFPLSTYPMFSHARGDYYRVTYFVGDDAERLNYRLAGTGGFNQVRRQIRRAAKEGRGPDLCAAVANRLAGQPDAPAEVAVVTGRFLLDGYFDGATAPVETEVHARCPVRSTP